MLCRKNNYSFNDPKNSSLQEITKFEEHICQVKNFGIPVLFFQTLVLRFAHSELRSYCGLTFISLFIFSCFFLLLTCLSIHKAVLVDNKYVILFFHSDNANSCFENIGKYFVQLFSFLSSSLIVCSFGCTDMHLICCNVDRVVVQLCCFCIIRITPVLTKNTIFIGQS